MYRMCWRSGAHVGVDDLGAVAVRAVDRHGATRSVAPARVLEVARQQLVEVRPGAGAGDSVEPKISPQYTSQLSSPRPHARMITARRSCWTSTPAVRIRPPSGTVNSA
jgi:hypothetical protein